MNPSGVILADSGREDNEIFLAAEAAYGEGLLPLPCAPGTKRPLCSWKKFQKQRPKWGELEKLFNSRSLTTFGTLTGQVTGRAVIDIDLRNGGSLEVAYGLGLPPTRTAITGGGGYHLHYQIPAGVKVKTQRLAPGIELKAEGGFAILPPSLHPETGEQYRWQDETAPIAELPIEFAGVKTPQPLEPKSHRDYIELLRGVPEGQRHTTATRLCGHWLRQGLGAQELSAILGLWNQANDPPLPEDELERIVNDLAHKERNNQGNQRLELPDICYLGILRDFCDLLEPFYEVPRAYWLFSLATIIGAAIAGKMTIESDLRVESRVYTVLLGQSGVVKKSTAIRRTLEFVEGAGCLPPVSYGVGSAEGLAEQLSETKDLLLVCDEFRIIMSKARIEGSVLGPMLATLFESGNFENRTKGKSLRVRGARLSLLAACTSESYQLVWDPHSLAIGLNNRLLVVAEESNRAVPFVEKVPEEKERALQARLSKLFEELHRRCERSVTLKLFDGREHEINDTRPVGLRLTSEAQKVWAEWYTARPKDLYSVRLDTIGMRLALVYAFAQGNLEEVDARTMDAVCRLLDWQHRVRTLYDPIDAQGKVAQMEVAIRRQLAARGPLTRRDLKRYTNAHRLGEWTFRTALENLLAAREVVYDKGTGCFGLAERAVIC